MILCLGFEPGTTRWNAQTNPLSYGRTHLRSLLVFNLDVLLASFCYLITATQKQKYLSRCVFGRIQTWIV